MRVHSLSVRNFRALADTGPLELGSTNVLIGPNNAGKSSLIRALYLMQDGSAPTPTDVRLGADEAQIRIALSGMGPASFPGLPKHIPDDILTITLAAAPYAVLEFSRMNARVDQLPAHEPSHFVVPYLSKRKAVAYAEQVGVEFARSVTPSFEHLAARLQRLGNPAFPAHDRYARTCEEILGFVVTAVPSANGAQPGVYVTQDEVITIQAMGEGVPNIVGLLADLALAKGKLFLIEELENDLHPRALKALLRLVLQSSEQNQFVVSTHSNIVARYLGSAADNKLFYVNSEREALPPEATVTEVGTDPNSRMAVLRDLGYELNDFNLWDGWIFLEESSAERIIRDHLIPWFAPGMVQRVRTLSANGNSNVEPTFEDFHRLSRFTHLEPAYRNRAWVLIDGDEAGREIIRRLQARYSPAWSPDRFRAFSQPAFEAYYPPRFADERQSTLNERNQRERREKKRQLLEHVRGWIEQEPDQAKVEFEDSARDVIGVLREIEIELFGAQ